MATTSPTVSTGKSMLSGPYMLEAGPYGVTETSDFVLQDAKRNQAVHVRLFYPDGPGPYPVILFSPGESDSPSCCDVLTRHWASYGYVTLQPIYDDTGSGRRAASRENGNSQKTDGEALDGASRWRSRSRDASFVLASLAEIQNRIPSLAGKIDAEHIGVGGHSTGAAMAEAFAGALDHLPGSLGAHFVDSRVKAVLLLSPREPGKFEVTDLSWDQVKLPLLSMTESVDPGAGQGSPKWREIASELAQPLGDKYQVFIQGVAHTSLFSSKSVSRGESILSYTNSASLAFWDAYLKADPRAKIYLQSGALADFSHGAAKLTRH